MERAAADFPEEQAPSLGKLCWDPTEKMEVKLRQAPQFARALHNVVKVGDFGSME